MGAASFYDTTYPQVLEKLWTGFEFGEFHDAETVLAKSIAVALDLRDVNEFAQAWARNRAGILIKDLSATADLNLKRTMARSFKEGWTEAETAEALSKRVGLTDQLATAVNTYRQALLAKGMGRGEAWNLAQDYSRKLRYDRAKRIAAYETTAAFTAAKHELWKTAIQMGELDPTTKRKWVTAKDEMTCKWCRPLNGRTVSLEAGIYTSMGKDVHGPPLHPHCRCEETLITGFGTPITPVFKQALEKIAKHGDKGDPGYRALHPNTRGGNRGQGKGGSGNEAGVIRTTSIINPLTGKPYTGTTEVGDVFEEVFHTKASGPLARLLKSGRRKRQVARYSEEGRNSPIDYYLGQEKRGSLHYAIEIKSYSGAQDAQIKIERSAAVKKLVAIQKTGATMTFAIQRIYADRVEVYLFQYSPAELKRILDNSDTKKPISFRTKSIKPAYTYRYQKSDIAKAMEKVKGTRT